MDTILEKLEVLIEDIEGNSQLTKEDIKISLNKLKEEIEDYNLRREEYTGGSINWEDLD